MIGGLPDDATRVLISLVLLLVGTASCLYVVRRRRAEVAAAGLATAGAIGWTLTGSAVDGPVLLVVAEGNGLHLGDLLALPAVLLVLFLALRGWQH